MEPQLIFYVRDQARSTAFYQQVLQLMPRVHVPGMTQFVLPNGTVLGLMPFSSVDRLFGRAVTTRAETQLSRAELYLVVANAEEYLRRARLQNATIISEFQPRDWGHSAGYCLDLDGNVLAFAE